MAAPFTGMTPQQVQYDRRYGGDLMQQGTDASPVGHWTQALARVLQGGVGGYMTGAADRGEREGRASGNALVAQALNGGNLKSSVGSMLAHPWAAEQGQKLAQSMINQRIEDSSPMAQARLKSAQGAEARASAMHPLQLQAAQLDVQSKQRELDNPAGKVTVLPDGSSAIITNTRTGQHEVIAAGGPKTPPGYRAVQGGLEAIPGGPADVKMNEKRQQDFASLQQMTQSLDGLERAANEVLQHKGLAGNYGMSGVFPNVPGGRAADAQALLETLKTRAAYATLQDMRNASKTGGALGAISDKETVMLQNSIAALGKAQSYEQVQRQLQQIIKETQASKARIQAAYADHWNNQGAAARQNPTQQAAPPAQQQMGAVAPGVYVFDPQTNSLQPRNGGQ